MTRWLVAFDAIDPKHLSSVWVTGVHEAHYKRLRNHGHEKQIARLVLVREVLLPEETTAIYRGWSRPGKDDCFVYCGEPTRDMKSLTIETPAPPGMVFLVFVLSDGTIDEWSWRPSSAGDGKPDGVNGELIWPLN